MITDVGIDIDGVLYDFAGAFHTYAERILERKLPAPSKWDFYTDWGLSDFHFQRMLRDATEEMHIFMMQPPLEGVHSGWQSLLDQDIKIHILTHRHPEAYVQTVSWLKINNLLPHGLHFGQNKTILKMLAKGECAAIDDHYLYYKEYVDAGIISFLNTQPWNQTFNGNRVANLNEFAELVRLYNEYHKHFAKSPKKQLPKFPNFSITQPNISPKKDPYKPHETATETRWYNWKDQTTEN